MANNILTLNPPVTLLINSMTVQRSYTIAPSDRMPSSAA